MGQLHSTHLKLARARRHRLEVDTTVGRFRQTVSWEVVPEVDPTTGEQLWVVRSLEPAPLDEIAVLLGDCLHNFRSALDHLAWELVRAGGGRQPDHRTMFPLHCDPKRVASTALHSLDGVPEEALAAIIRMQPCFGANEYRNGMLDGLNRFENIDKHRHLNVIVTGTDGAFWEPGGAPSMVHQGAVRPGSVLAAFPPAEHQAQFFPVAGVALDESNAPAHGSILQILMGIDFTVTDTINQLSRMVFPREPQFPLPER